MCGSLSAALMLQQLLYWWDKKSGDTVFKTVDEMKAETRLGRKAQLNAISKLSKLGFITVEYRGLPRKRHYIVNIAHIDENILYHTSPVVPNGANKSSPLGTTSRHLWAPLTYTENTTENTTEREGGYRHLSFLEELPDNVVKELAVEYNCTATQVREKAGGLVDYCKSKGKSYKNYLSFLRNALLRDYGKRPPRIML